MVTLPPSTSSTPRTTARHDRHSCTKPGGVSGLAWNTDRTPQPFLLPCALPLTDSHSRGLTRVVSEPNNTNARAHTWSPGATRLGVAFRFAVPIHNHYRAVKNARCARTNLPWKSYTIENQGGLTTTPPLVVTGHRSKIPKMTLDGYTI